MNWKLPDDSERRELRKKLLRSNSAAQEALSRELVAAIAASSATSGFAILEEVEGEPT